MYFPKVLLLIRAKEAVVLINAPGFSERMSSGVDDEYDDCKGEKVRHHRLVTNFSYYLRCLVAGSPTVVIADASACVASHRASEAKVYDFQIKI